jgi:AraC-like DNA-binding protein
MFISRSYKPTADPLSQILAALGTHSIGHAWLEAAGEWALPFPATERLRFLAVLHGTCWLLPGKGAPQFLSAGDVALIGHTDFVVASDPSAPQDNWNSVEMTADDRLRLRGDDVRLLGGGLAFSPGTSSFLLNSFPPSVVILGSSSAASAIRSLLLLLDREAREPGLGGEAVTAHLADVLIVEAIRLHANHAGADHVGWLRALVDPRIGRALHSFHADIAQPWTVALLATEAGMSRAAFSSAFHRLVGRPPLDHVRAWRLTSARARLAAGASAASAAFEVGYTSQSAFGYAYRRFFGMPPGKSIEGFPKPADEMTSGDLRE